MDQLVPQLYSYFCSSIGPDSCFHIIQPVWGTGTFVVDKELIWVIGRTALSFQICFLELYAVWSESCLASDNGHFWHCLYSVWSRVYETVGHLSVRLSFCPIWPPHAAMVSLLLWAWRAGDIDWLLHGWRATAAASSVVLLADVDLLNLLFYSVCAPPMQAPGHNAPLIWFLISVLYTLFACLCRMFPHLSFFFFTFHYFSPPLFISSLTYLFLWE